MTQSRWKSKVLWIGIISVIILIMRNYGLYTYIGMDEAVFKLLLDTVLGILITLGIVNDPNVSDKW